MGYANGRLPSSVLRAIPGGRIRVDVVDAWLAFCDFCQQHFHAVPRPNGPNSSYRTIAMQYLMKRLYGSNAATPGTSNHGLALALDLPNWVTDLLWRVGQHYGFYKPWSDASWERWHIKALVSVCAKFRGRHRKPNPLIYLHKDERHWVRMYLHHRKKMLREARTGKGPRYRKQLRYARHYKHLLKVRRKHIQQYGRERNGAGWRHFHRAIRFQIIHHALVRHKAIP